MDTAPEPGMPDTRDWTAVLDGGCDECGYRPHDPEQTAERLRAAADRWHRVLARADVARRPAPRVWSPLEYAGHSRDLIEVLGDRLSMMLETDDPTYDDFDGEVAVREHEYWKADPVDLARGVEAATERTLEILGRVGAEDVERPGRRGDGYVFTVGTLCQYIVHDVEHHLWDVDG
ncbi:MAG TPA: DinB family protein [Candidatus Dietzia intestinipullorum]|nr:DinB family protein [Candidatus Dietzia intestinipullorum]